MENTVGVLLPHGYDSLFKLRLISSPSLTIYPVPSFLCKLHHFNVVQTMLSLPSRSIDFQGAPTPHSERASPLEISAQIPIPLSGPPAPAPPTQLAANTTGPAATSVPLLRASATAPPPGGIAPASPSVPALPEISNLPPRRVPVIGGDFYHRSTARHTEGDTDRVIVRS